MIFPAFSARIARLPSLSIGLSFDKTLPTHSVCLEFIGSWPMHKNSPPSPRPAKSACRQQRCARKGGPARTSPAAFLRHCQPPPRRSRPPGAVRGLPRDLRHCATRSRDPRRGGRTPEIRGPDDSPGTCTPCRGRGPPDTSMRSGPVLGVADDHILWFTKIRQYHRYLSVDTLSIHKPCLLAATVHHFTASEALRPSLQPI